MTKGKGVTLLGVALSTLSAFALHPDVQSVISPKYVPFVTLAGTLLAAVGPSLRKQK